MIARCQPPTHSPLHTRALLRGLRGALGADTRARLRQDIQTHWGSKDVVLTDSGTTALQLAMRAVLAQRPGLIAIPAYACYDIATAALGAGAQVVLYDVDPDTLAPAPESLRAALGARPSALVLIHAFGIPVDVHAVRQMISSETVIIEDAAQALGATIDGAPAGSHGSLAVLSFGRGKGLTGGAGGALLTNDERGASLVGDLNRRFAESRAGWGDWIRCSVQWALARPSLYGIPASLPFLRLGETVFHPPHQPQAITRSAAAIVQDVWAAAFDAVAVRQRNAQRFSAIVEAGIGWRIPHVPRERTAGFLRFPLRNAHHTREELLTRWARRLGIIEGYPQPLALLPGFREHCVNAQTPMPGAAELAKSLVTLPTHGLLSANELRGIGAWLTR